jgi:hypothetical protein
MGADRALQAIGRIERALARIEGSAARPQPAPQGSSQVDERLAAAHETLRGKVEAAIAQIDELLGAGEAA